MWSYITKMSNFWEQQYVLSVISSDDKINISKLNSFYQRVESKIKEIHLLSLDGKIISVFKNYEDLEKYLWEKDLCY